MAFEYAQKVLFRHCDPAGIVFFPRYFEMMNDCVEAFFDSALRWPFEALHRVQAVPTAGIETRFRAPSRHGDQLTLALEIEAVGRTSCRYLMRARCGDEARFETRATLVLVGETGRPEAWPDPIRAKLTDIKEGRG
ncbi:thioesterase family protein [Oceanicola granulosus HTCC2516]|uniref:Thioesterase family protein n=1 Tax=Oceanicola granulosus (strain ATCC BAA-861 / DSM 15982 / KCTC 12143 / HTCC2516) TaxID=314256 RepID=Q2CHF0_OCEGH|nr:acyl-CoA thioesterase [Oceanicola granulosus]EAR52089.1 thioesterase family protein [Oceanicola granulosus HTCC2516]